MKEYLVIVSNPRGSSVVAKHASEDKCLEHFRAFMLGGEPLEEVSINTKLWLDKVVSSLSLHGRFSERGHDYQYRLQVWY